MSKTSILRDSNDARHRFNKSIVRTIERLEGKLALMATWEQAGGEKKYLQQLKGEATKLRQQLRVKGVIFDDEIDD